MRYMNKLEEIIESIRELRDADFHVCPYDEWQNDKNLDLDHEPKCTCHHFDAVIDELEKLK